MSQNLLDNKFKILDFTQNSDLNEQIIRNSSLLIEPKTFTDSIDFDQLFEDISLSNIASGVFGSGVSGQGIELGVSGTTGYLQSKNYVSGTTGWKIDSTGVVEFVSGTFSGTLAAGISITSPTITGGTLQTAATGVRTVISGNDVYLYDDTTLGVGNSASLLFPRTDANWGSNYFIVRKRTSTADDYDNVLEIFPSGAASVTGSNYIFLGRDGINTSATYAKTLTLAASNNISFEDTTSTRYLNMRTGQIDVYKDIVCGSGVDIVPTTTFGNIGGSSNRWATIYGSAGNFDGNITVTGTVDGVDISDFVTLYNAHAGDASAHHSSTSNALNITPTTCVAAGTGSGTSSALKAVSICTTSGLIYYGADLVFDMYSASVRVSKMLGANSAAAQNLGDDTFYWNDVNYKTLTDRGCLGCFDEGVELQNGKKVSDLEALKSIKKHPILKTTYGVPRFDYKTMPKAVYKIANRNGIPLDRDENDKPYSFDEKTKEKRFAEDGAELTALVSIMIGAVKELDKRIEKLEK